MNNSTDIFNDLLTKYHENKLAHAFLLESNDVLKCYSEVIGFIKNICNESNIEGVDFDSLISNNSLPSLITISPDGQFIKKEQILDMMSSFSTKPVYTDYNFYVITAAERLNNSSANVLLKFLEEPEDNIIGFFITDNKENVINTIRSRCQNYSVYYDLSLVDDINDEILTDVKLYLNSIYKNSDDLLYNKTHMSGYYEDRNDWEIFFRTMLYYIKSCISTDRKDKIKMINSISIENLVNIMILIEKVIKYIKSNVNIELVLDMFVIEMRHFYE